MEVASSATASLASLRYARPEQVTFAAPKMPGPAGAAPSSPSSRLELPLHGASRKPSGPPGAETKAKVAKRCAPSCSGDAGARHDFVQNPTFCQAAKAGEGRLLLLPSLRSFSLQGRGLPSAEEAESATSAILRDLLCKPALATGSRGACLSRR